MIQINARGFGAFRTPASVGLLAIGLVANTAAPVLAQTSGTWSKSGSMKNARDQTTATLLPNGHVLVAGGYDGTSISAGAELHDPSKRAWTVTGSMAETRSNHTATLLPHGELL